MTRERVSYNTSPRGAELSGLTLACALERVVAERHGMKRDAVIEAALARLQRAVDEILRAMRDPDSAAGSRLRADLIEQLRWMVEAGHIREVEVERGEFRYRTR